uniref:Major sperm protein n=1 Tax=Meloidogyne javanica TaxID=6303 RepID=A0A915MH23_MELJA
MRGRAGVQRQRSPSPLRSGFEIVEQVRVTPKRLVFNAKGGYDSIILSNDSTGVKYAYKVMSTDNDFFKFTPIIGFLSASTAVKIHVLRERGPQASGDRCEILLKRVDQNIKDPVAVFVGKTVPDCILQVELLTR